MKRLLLLVEGETEEEFVKSILNEHLWTFGVDAQATQICTKRIEGRRVHRGGGKNYDFIKQDILGLLGSKPEAVSTLLDYYALPTNFPGRQESSKLAIYDRIRHLEKAFSQDIGHRLFIPNLVLHEFEALLFANPEQLKLLIEKPADVNALDRLMATVASPEEINDGEQTAPSKRVQAWIPDYQKRFHGPQLLKKIGMAGIRSKCRHFDEWLTRLERL